MQEPFEIETWTMHKLALPSAKISFNYEEWGSKNQKLYSYKSSNTMSRINSPKKA